MFINILIFSILQLVNVFLATMKSIIQIKGSKLQATLMNSFYYAFYVVVVIFMIADFSLWIKVLITFVTNLISTWGSMTLLEYLRKDRLWKIEASVKSQYTAELHKALRQANIQHSYIEDVGKYTIFNLYCRTKSQSRQAKELLNNVSKNTIKYFVSESRTL